VLQGFNQTTFGEPNLENKKLIYKGAICTKLFIFNSLARAAISKQRAAVGLIPF